MQHDPHQQGYILGGLTHRVTALEEARDKMRKDLDTLRAWLLRSAILGTLWAAAIGSHLSRDQAAELLAALLKAALKL